MLGVIVNTAAVILGSLIGLGGKKIIPERMSGAVMTAIALCTLAIGIDGVLQDGNTLLLIAAMVLGTIVGTLLNIDGLLNRIGEQLEQRTKNDGKTNITQGFVTGSLLFCVGALTIVGSLNAGISGDNSLLYAKSLLDFVSSIMLTASMGIGVIFAAAVVFVLQGLLVVLAGVLQPLLVDAAIAEIVLSGSLMIIALSLNMLGVTKIKVADMLPALIIAPLLYAVSTLIPPLTGSI